MIRALSRVARLVAFLGWFAREVVTSGAAVVRDALTPGSAATPRVVRLPLARDTAVHTTLLGAAITLTPGTLTLGVEGRPPALLVHSMYHRDEASALEDLRDMERRLLRATAPRLPEEAP